MLCGTAGEETAGRFFVLSRLKELADRFFLPQYPADSPGKLLVDLIAPFNVQFKDEVHLVDEVLHILYAPGDLHDLHILHVEQPADLLELCITPSVDLVYNQDDRLPDREESLNVLDDPDILLERVNIREILLIASGTHLSFIVNRVAKVRDIGAVPDGLYGVRYFANSLNTADQDILALPDRLPDIVYVVTAEGYLIRIIFLCFFHAVRFSTPSGLLMYILAYSRNQKSAGNGAFRRANIL